MAKSKKHNLPKIKSVSTFKVTDKRSSRDLLANQSDDRNNTPTSSSQTKAEEETSTDSTFDRIIMWTIGFLLAGFVLTAVGLIVLIIPYARIHNAWVGLFSDMGTLATMLASGLSFLTWSILAVLVIAILFILVHSFIMTFKEDQHKNKVDIEYEDVTFADETEMEDKEYEAKEDEAK